MSFTRIWQICIKKQKQMEKAEFHFEYALKINNQDLDLLYNYGLFCFEQKRITTAKELWLKCLKIEDEFEKS